MPITLVQLRAFVAVFDADGFSAAADETGTTQAALSWAVGSLERAVGARVLQRQPRLALTELGANLLPHARAAVAAAERVRLAAELHSGRAVGTVRLAASTTALAGVLPGLRARWSESAPGVELVVLEGEDEEMSRWLEDGLVDAAILLDLERPDTRAKVVGRDEFEAVVRRDHPFAGLPAIPVTELLDDPVLISDTGCRAEVLAICRRADPSFEPAGSIRELETVMSMVAAGVGVSIIPGLGRSLIHGNLALVPLQPTVTRTLVLTGPSTREWSPLVSALLDTPGIEVPPER